MQREKVVIIGGGLSGVLAAMRLAEMEHGPEITLLEKDPEKLGRGVAYQQEFTHQPLNVVAANMSLFPGKPDDFVKWLEENAFRYNHLIKNINATSFVPRKIFGDYLVERLKEVHDRLEGRFLIRIDEAISILGTGKNKTVVLSSGVTLQASKVILALGNFPPADILEEHKDVKNDPRYFSNPWTDKVYHNIKGDEHILLMGTGLTAVDVVLGLHVRNFTGKILMLSRSGRLPLPHYISSQKYTWDAPYLLPPGELFKAITGCIKNNPDVPWPLILDSIRPYTQKIWSFWSTEQKAVFLKRFRPFWEIARHRIPNDTAEVLDKLMKAGTLKISKGKLISTVKNENGFETVFVNPEGEKTISFQKIINCTGPESNYRKIKFPIIRDLIERGKVVPDALGLGISCTEEGAIINKDQQIEEGMWCVGPMRKAALWETTALKEIRDQVEGLVNSMQKVRA
ncbi:MAG: putative hydroxyacylglutathione hydrolase [Bacteroidetes bacterium]|nr:putative hydroxyacylglutathione hydrolase [Bacteroidota bacterium]